MKVELLSTIGEDRTGLARLETINTHIENSGESLSPGVSVKPFVELIREYESKPNLAMPLILSGIGMSLEGSEIVLEQPETLRAIVEATHLPISDELLSGTTELVTLGLDRLVVWLKDGKQFSAQFGSEVFQELTVSDYATRMASEQPEVRKLIRGYVKNHSGGKLPLSNMSAYIRGGEVRILRPEKPRYPEPNAERITKIKELFFKLGINSVWFTDLGRDYSISFKKEWMATRTAPNQQWNRTLFVELGRDFTDYSSWKLQKKVTPVMVDMDRLETDFEEVGANAGFATLGYQDNGFTLKVTRPDYKEQANGRSILHNPGLYVGSTEQMSIRQSEDFIQGYIQRFGRQIDLQVGQHFLLPDLNDKV